MSKYADLSKYKDLAKDRASNLKGGVKGKVNGVLGRKSTAPDANHDRRVAAPLSSLRDPSTFAPPPKRSDSGLSPPPLPSLAPRRLLASPDKMASPEEDDGEDPKPPSLPYRMNTTGLSTSHLPPPPTRRDTGADEKNPPSYDATMKSRRAPAVAPSPGPGLPPRLPARSESTSPEKCSPSPAPGTLNQVAVSRLGAAGVSVPAFGIGPRKSGGSGSAQMPPRPDASPLGQLGALSGRFSKMASPSSSAEAVATVPSEGTTWAQKEAAFKTASAFRKDPKSVSLADARAAASTVNNFRQRHGDQVSAGLDAANNFNQKYGVADKVGDLAAQPAGGQPPASGVAGKKKPPPPPPKKKPGLQNASTEDLGVDVPPPIPYATRPAF